MKLSEFVAQTLNSIIEGVKTAQSDKSNEGAIINPVNLSFGKDFEGVKYGWARTKNGINMAHLIEFDVGVTTVEDQSKEGGAGIFVGPVALGAKGGESQSSSMENKIRFSVPILLPPGE